MSISSSASAPLDFLEALRPIFDCLADGICVADAEGRLLYANAAAGALLGPASQEAGDRDICGLLCGGLKGTCGETAASCPLKVPAGPVNAATFLGVYRPSGRDLRVRCLRVALAHLERHFIVIEDDSAAAELARRQEELRQMFAHDARVPLTSALGILRALEDMGEGHALSARDLKLVSIGARSCGRIGELIDSYLETSRLEDGAMPMTRSPVDAGSLLRDCAAEAAEAARVRGLELRIDAAEGLFARADPGLLRRALSNLIGNALKFTPSGGRVALTAAERNGSILIRVSDDGPGIAAQELPRIFERFYQGATAGRRGGFGLGLTFCRAALLAMGGDVSAESEEGKGSVFTVRLPRSAAGEREAL